jgi:hypothetical protein
MAIQLIVISSPGSISRVATADMARSFLVNLLYALMPVSRRLNPLPSCSSKKRVTSTHFGSQA